MEYFNIIFELVILLMVYTQFLLTKRQKRISVIVIGAIVILAEIIYILFFSSMIESIINMILIAVQGSLIGTNLLLKNR